jgi:hypothetical protein
MRGGTNVTAGSAKPMRVLQDLLPRADHTKSFCLVTRGKGQLDLNGIGYGNREVRRSNTKITDQPQGPYPLNIEFPFSISIG